MFFYNHISHPSQNIIRLHQNNKKSNDNNNPYHYLFIYFEWDNKSYLKTQQGSIEIDIDIEVAPFPLITVL